MPTRGANVLGDESRLFNPGLARHHMRILRPVKTKNSFGGDVSSWQVYATVDAQVIAGKGREFEANSERYAEAVYTLRMQYIPGVEREYKVQWAQQLGTIDLDIVDVQDPVGMSNYTAILAVNRKTR